MKAMILAAGLGTRLAPLTDQWPKALVRIGNVPMIARVIQYLKGFGVDHILVNAHHHADRLAAYLDAGRPFNLPLEVRFEPEILGTGGGIKNNAGFWGPEPFMVINSDILTDIPLDQAYAFHRQSGNLATLILHDYPPHSRVIVDGDSQITDIAPENKAGRLAFTGIQIINPGLLDYIPAGCFYHIMDTYRELIRMGKPPRAYIARGHYWYDIGSIASYIEANKKFGQPSPHIGQNCSIDSSAKFEDWVIIGDACTLEKDVQLKRSILWEGVRIKSGVRLKDSVVTAGKTVDQDLDHAVI